MSGSACPCLGREAGAGDHSLDHADWRQSCEQSGTASPTLLVSVLPLEERILQRLGASVPVHQLRILQMPNAACLRTWACGFRLQDEAPACCEMNSRPHRTLLRDRPRRRRGVLHSSLQRDTRLRFRVARSSTTRSYSWGRGTGSPRSRRARFPRALRSSHDKSGRDRAAHKSSNRHNLERMTIAKKAMVWNIDH